MELISRTYKQTDIGLIPNDWEVKRLGDLSNIVGGGTPSTFRAEFWNGNINWFTPTEIGMHKYSFDSERKITKKGLENSSARMLPKGTILLTSRAGIGDVSILMKEASTNQGFQSLIPKEDCCNEYLYYLVSTLKNIFLQNASGSTFLEISSNKIKAIKVPYPPTRAEQTAVVNVLSDTDRYIGGLEKLVAKKRLIKQGTMQELLKPKEGWEVKTLGEIVIIRKGQLITDTTRINGNIPVIAGGKTPAYFHNTPNRIGNTITISGSGASAGYVSFHNYPIFASDCSTIEEGKNYSIEFIFFFLQLIQERIYKMQTGGAQPHIHPSDLNPIEISIPNKDIQCHIATILKDMDKEIITLEKRLDKVKLIKQGMMQQLLTGKIRLV